VRTTDLSFVERCCKAQEQQVAEAAAGATAHPPNQSNSSNVEVGTPTGTVKARNCTRGRREARGARNVKVEVETEVGVVEGDRASIVKVAV